ncbi:Rossmann-fold NAD(P)-binding domain-containing protein [Litchfieldia alkalitelluris]|uniref:oxidoreductase n=1 Tax=Litchfieldia alkalitelluris TaxID=304268 RepID=UPI001F42B3C2|nr:oxidoreductase [Litchfieldia alkalitelluris]
MIGHELLHLLLDGNEYGMVTALVRSPLQIKHSKLREVIIDFDQLSKYKDLMHADDIYCCLGTTIKKAKTKEAMYKVDVEYPIELAKLTYEVGARQYLLVSSMNANAQSTIWYSKMKGELEQELMKIPFSSTAIVRPSLLMGERNEFRLGEKLAEKVFKGLSFIFTGP